MSTGEASSTTRLWYVPDAYIPPASTGPEESHESICVLNPSGAPVLFTITAYFADREPELSLPITLGRRRAEHLRTDQPDRMGGLKLRRGVPYGLAIESQADLHVQYSRLDTTQASYSIMTATLSASVGEPSSS